MPRDKSRARKRPHETRFLDFRRRHRRRLGPRRGDRAPAGRARRQGRLFDLNEELGEKLAKEIGGVFCKVNVTSDAEVDAAFAKARAAHGQERILVNCAGIGNAIKTVSRDKETGEIKEFPLDELRTHHPDQPGRHLPLHRQVGGRHADARSAAEDGDRGAIVNTASVAAEDGQIGQAAYSASKAGIVGMTLPVARDLSSEGIRVNTILPGIFDTPLLARAPEKVQGGARRHGALPQAPRPARRIRAARARR